MPILAGVHQVSSWAGNFSGLFLTQHPRFLTPLWWPVVFSTQWWDQQDMCGGDSACHATWRRWGGPGNCNLSNHEDTHKGVASSGRSPGTWETCIHHRFPRALSLSALFLSLKHLVLCFLFLDTVPDSLCWTGAAALKPHLLISTSLYPDVFQLLYPYGNLDTSHLLLESDAFTNWFVFVLRKNKVL